jgi:hypothetical protein
VSYLGSFSRTRKGDFTIEHKGGRNEYPFFNADNVTILEEAQQNYKRAASYGESWSCLGLTVSVSKNGIELASNSIWGIETDSDESYFLEVFNDLAPETLKEAKETLKQLCECYSNQEMEYHYVKPI